MPLPVVFEGGPHHGLEQVFDILPPHVHLPVESGPVTYQRACVISAKRHVYRYVPQQSDGERPPQSAAPHGL